jgi:hypothetical protein
LAALTLSACSFVDSGGSGANDAPSVSGAGITADEETQVVLTSSVSDDFDKIESYLWQQVSGPPVTLSGADQPNASFIAPTVRSEDSPLALGFQLTVTDNFGESGVGDVTVMIIAVNDPPVVKPDSATVAEGASQVIDVLANDADPDGQIDPASVAIVTAATNGAATVSPAGTINYVHDGSETLSDSLSYTVKDNEGAVSTTATVSITVTPVNDPPVIVDQTPKPLVTPEDVPISLDLSNLIVTDPDNSYPSGFTLAVLAGDNYDRSGTTITPDRDFNGNLAVRVRVNDGTDDSNIFNLALIVTPVNDRPVARNDSAGTDEGTSVTIDVLANDSDVEGALDRGSVTVISGPANGTTSVNTSNGRVTYTPNADFSGTDSFQYRVADAEGLTDTATVTVTVRNINDPPTITPIPNQTIDEDGSTGALSFTVGDEETAPADFSVTAGSSNTTLVPNANLALGGSGANRSITVTPAANQNGSTTIKVTVSDGEASASTSFTVTVTAVPDPPVAEDDNATTPVDTDVTIDVLANDVGVDAALDRGSVTVTSGPANGTTSVNPGNGRVTYTPNANFSGTDSFVYRVADAEGLTDTATVTITVTPGFVGLLSADVNTTGCWTTPQGQALTATLADAQASPQTTYAILTAPQKGSVVLVDPTTGEFRYVPNASGPRGSDSFDYRIDDPQNGATTRTATVIIDQAIIPLGDSVTAGITDGTGGLPAVDQRVGYRKPLYDGLGGAGYSIDLAGSLVAGSGIPGFDADHDGHTGWSADELAFGRPLGGTGGIFAWLSAHPADVVLLHVGTDVLTTSTMGIASILDEIDRWERSALGNPVTVIVARIIDRAPSSPDVQAFNANLTQMVAARKADPANPDALVLVDQSVALSYPTDLADGRHPTATGYAKMADVWFSALVDPKADLLQKCP